MSSSSFLTGAVAGALGGVAAAWFVLGTLDPNSGEGSPRSAPELAPKQNRSALVLALEERVAAMESASTERAMRLAALEDGRVDSQRSSVEDWASEQDFRAFEAEVRAWMEASPLGHGSQASAQVQEQVEIALAAIEQRNAAADQERKRRTQEQKTEIQVGKLRDWLGMDAGQVEGLRAAMQRRDELQAELARRWQSGDSDPESLSEEKVEIRATYRADLQSLLTPQQWETYTARERGGAATKSGS